MDEEKREELKPYLIEFAQGLYNDVIVPMNRKICLLDFKLNQLENELILIKSQLVEVEKFTDVIDNLKTIEVEENEL